MPQWGASTTNELRPIWRYLQKLRGHLGQHLYATSSGWVVKWPWGEEIVVGIGGLAGLLGRANTAGIDVLTTSVENVATSNVAIAFGTNEPVAVNGVPTIVAIGTGAMGNVTLAYSASLSEPTAGFLVFANAAASLGNNGYANTTLTVNASSVAAGWAGITDPADSNNAIANGVPAGISCVVNIYQEKPIHTGTLRVGTATNTANQFVGFALKFNEPLTIIGTPTVLAVGDANAAMNLVLSYVQASSNCVDGNIVFKSAATSFAAKTMNVVFTVNSTIQIVGIAGITDARGKAPSANLAVANTFTVTTA